MSTGLEFDMCDLEAYIFQLSNWSKMDSDEFTLQKDKIISMLDKHSDGLHTLNSKLIGRILRSKTYKAGRVVIPHCFGVSVGLQQRVGSSDLILQKTLKITFLKAWWHFAIYNTFIIHMCSIFTLFACIFPGTGSAFFPDDIAIAAKYWMKRLVSTVFPAPDSPPDCKIG